jgi:2-polyprenyl-3-methyl-5-hydroxy-6-metoxy-1,4-benzoquinol methylase
MKKSATAWYESWFNTDLYYHIYANRNHREAAVLANLIEKKIPVSRYNNLLDLACGRGRHSIQMALKGYNVTGVDLATKALETAKMHALEFGVEQKTHFVQKDMRSLGYQNEFDAVINVFTSFGYFSDQENIQVIQQIANALRPKGLFLFDYLNPVTVEKNLMKKEEGVYLALGLSYDIERWIENNIVYKSISLSDKNKDVYTTQEQVCLYERSWFEEHFKNAGLQIKESYGNYEGLPFNAKESPRQLYLCEKS